MGIQKTKNKVTRTVFGIIAGAVLIVACLFFLKQHEETLEQTKTQPTESVADTEKDPAPIEAQPSEQEEASDAPALAEDRVTDGFEKAGMATEETVEPDVEMQIVDFESDVIDNANVLRVRLETPELIEARDTGQSPGPAPGYVAFMASPEAMDEGMYNTMQDIAQRYFQQFPESPRVTVSLVVGGGIKDRETFFNNEDGPADIHPPIQ